jgi:predicted nucleic acid-binding protein
MTTYGLDTSVIISHLRGDRLANETDRFFRRAIDKEASLVMPDVVYAELYTGIYLSANPRLEEARVQSFLAVNGIEVRTSRSLKVAKRAGQIYSMHLKRMGAGIERILPNFLIAAQVEAISKTFVTWNVSDYQNLGLRVPVCSPQEA